MRLSNIITCLTVTGDTLEILADNLKGTFLEALSNTTQSLLKNIQVNLSTDFLHISDRGIQDCETKQDQLHCLDGTNT
jgi:hypothetical protein